jgi:hypothetical protein
LRLQVAVVSDMHSSSTAHEAYRKQDTMALFSFGERRDEAGVGFLEVQRAGDGGGGSELGVSLGCGGHVVVQPATPGSIICQWQHCGDGGTGS